TQSGNAIRQRNQATQSGNANRQRKQTTQTDNANRQRKQTTQTDNANREGSYRCWGLNSRRANIWSAATRSFKNSICSKPSDWPTTFLPPTSSGGSCSSAGTAAAVRTRRIFVKTWAKARST